MNNILFLFLLFRISKLYRLAMYIALIIRKKGAVNECYFLRKKNRYPVRRKLHNLVNSSDLSKGFWRYFRADQGKRYDHQVAVPHKNFLGWFWNWFAWRKFLIAPDCPEGTEGPPSRRWGEQGNSGERGTTKRSYVCKQCHLAAGQAVSESETLEGNSDLGSSWHRSNLTYS